MTTRSNVVAAAMIAPFAMSLGLARPITGRARAENTDVENNNPGGRRWLVEHPGALKRR